MPYFVICEVLGPFVELSGYAATVLGLCLGWISGGSALLFFAVSILFGLLMSVSSVLLEEMTSCKYPGPRDLLQLLLAAGMENLDTSNYPPVEGTGNLSSAAEAERHLGKNGAARLPTQNRDCINGHLPPIDKYMRMRTIFVMLLAVYAVVSTVYFVSHIGLGQKSRLTTSSGTGSPSTADMNLPIPPPYSEANAPLLTGRDLLARVQVENETPIH